MTNKRTLLHSVLLFTTLHLGAVMLLVAVVIISGMVWGIGKGTDNPVLNVLVAALWILTFPLGVIVQSPFLLLLLLPVCSLLFGTIVGTASHLVRNAKTERSNQASDVTSEPAPGADSSPHQG